MLASQPLCPDSIELVFELLEKNHPFEKNSELVDGDEDVVAWYDLCRKKSSEIRGGEIATVTEEDEWAPESAGDPKTQKLKNKSQNSNSISIKTSTRLKMHQVYAWENGPRYVWIKTAYSWITPYDIYVSTTTIYFHTLY